MARGSRSSAPAGQLASPGVILPTGLSPVRYRNIAEQIASALRQAIVTGTIAPGGRLLEVPIAREMGTSRAPVREAISQLEREGLLVKEPNRGARVVEVTEQTVREVGDLRSLLEGYAASLAADRMGAKDFRSLDAILDRMTGAAADGQFARLLELDYEFHAFVCRASGNRALYEAWSAMGGKIRLYLSATNLAYRDLKAIVIGHKRVADALRARDAARASRALATHLAEVLEMCVQRMRTPKRGKGAAAVRPRRDRP